MRTNLTRREGGRLVSGVSYTHKQDLKNGISDLVEDNPVINSNEFIEKYAGFLRDLALYERDKSSGAKKVRNLAYANIGALDTNDLIQEAYMCFIEAYTRLDMNREDIVNAPEDEKGAIVWSFLKVSTIRRFERRLRELKDGVRITEWGMFGKTKDKTEAGVNTNYITKSFSQLDKVFMKHDEEMALTPHQQDLIGLFLEVQMDKYLDRTFKDEVNPKGIERDLVKRLYGIDTPEETYAELENYYHKSKSTLRKVVQRALDKLKTNESRLEIAEFAYSYKMNFASWVDKETKDVVKPGIYEWYKEYLEKDQYSCHKPEESVYIINDTTVNKKFFNKNMISNDSIKSTKRELPEYIDEGQVELKLGRLIIEEADKTIKAFDKDGNVIDILSIWESKDKKRVWKNKASKEAGQSCVLHNAVATINDFELQYSPEHTFTIGNNKIKGGI